MWAHSKLLNINTLAKNIAKTVHVFEKFILRSRAIKPVLEKVVSFKALRFAEKIIGK